MRRTSKRVPSRSINLNHFVIARTTRLRRHYSLLLIKFHEWQLPYTIAVHFSFLPCRLCLDSCVASFKIYAEQHSIVHSFPPDLQDETDDKIDTAFVSLFYKCRKAESIPWIDLSERIVQKWTRTALRRPTVSTVLSANTVSTPHQRNPHEHLRF